VSRGARYGALVASMLRAAGLSVRAANVPAGFNDSLHVLLTAPGSFAFDPSGNLWISQHTGLSYGRVWLYDGGLTRLVLTLPTNEIGERGIHTIEVDPDFATNKRIWLFYTTPGPPIRDRLSHFTYAAGQPGSEVAVFEGPAVEADYHNGGSLAFAADKTVYLGIGDDSGGSGFAQNPSVGAY
jgi:glucose/arabinose dehydrogenase